MNEDEDLQPTFTIKKRAKKSLRPSTSSTIPSTPSTSTWTTDAVPLPSTQAAVEPEEDEEETPTVVVRRTGSLKKKGPSQGGAARVKELSGSGGGSGGKERVKSRLSFGASAPGDDEEEEALTSTSTLRKLLRPTPSLSRSTSTSQPQSLSTLSISDDKPSIYSKEYLNQLKASTAGTPRNSTDSRGEYDQLTRDRFGSRLDVEQNDPMIPTTSAIQEARDRRERARLEGGTSNGSDGFVSLDVGFANKGGESRLVREEDELGDGDEELAEFTGATTLLPLGKKANLAAAQRFKSNMGELIHDAEEEMEDGEDEEMREWEEAQIRRGGSRRAVAEEEGRGRGGKEAVYRAAAIPSSTTLPTLSSVSARLSTALTEAKTNLVLDSSALDHFAHEREELDAQETDLREQVGVTEEKSRWFREFKGFIEEVGAFLDVKVPELENIEKENLAIQKERYEIVSRRRYEDNSDDVALFTGSPVPATVPSADVAASDSQRDPRDTPPPVDDDLLPRSQLRLERRERRFHRLAARPAPITATAEDEDYFTDDALSPASSEDLAEALTRLREQLAGLFADVKVDDFRDPNLGIRKRFEEWRGKWGEEYEMAFGGLALVGVWEFWARVEMALWNPFEISQLAKSPAGLDSYQWHQNLSSYGHSASHTNNGDAPEGGGEDDEAQTLVNELVTKVVVPRLEKFASESWDPMSRKQNMRALGLIDEVSYCVARSSAKFESLVQAFLSRLQLTIHLSQTLIAPHLSTISLPQNAFDPSTFAARNRFASRHLKLIQHALRWRRWAKGLRVHGPADGDDGGRGTTLDELVVRELVAKVLLPVVEAGWTTGGEAIAQKILTLLPPDAVPPALKRRLEGEK